MDNRNTGLIPNIITAFGLSCGLFIIFTAGFRDVSENFYSSLRMSSILLIFAGIADMADGAVARMIKAESLFGGQFDTLSDSITFGIAPTLLVLRSVGATDVGFIKECVVIGAAIIYAFCGVLRLVRFTVGKTLESDKDAPSTSFKGLPIPAACLGLISIPLLLYSPFFSHFIQMTSSQIANISAIAMIVLGLLMISKRSFPKLKPKQPKMPLFCLLGLGGFACFLLTYVCLNGFEVTLFVITWIYIIANLLMGFLKRNKNA